MRHPKLFRHQRNIPPANFSCRLTVCKTCSDYKHVCLGYSESTAHLRSHSDSASRAPPVASLASNNDTSQGNTRAVESCSPEPSHAPLQQQQKKPEKSPQDLKPSDSKDGSSRDTSARTNKEVDSQLAGDSPESSKSRKSRQNKTLLGFCRSFDVDRTDFGSQSRSYFHELHESHACPLFPILRPDCHRPGLQTNGWPLSESSTHTISNRFQGCTSPGVAQKQSIHVIR